MHIVNPISNISHPRVNSTCNSLLGFYVSEHYSLESHISQLVKDIRRLVDNGEFLSSKHARSPVVKLMVTLLLELITDHSREVRIITVDGNKSF